jgi:predicted dehydrogenase
VCTRRPERAQAAAERFNIPNVVTDYEEMIRMDGLDAVSVVTPVSLHHPVTMAALAAGKHVICEKPFTTNQSLAREMWQEAQRRNVTAMIGHEFRFSSARMRVKELLDEGYIGTPKFAFVKLLLGQTAPRQVRPFVPGREVADQGAGFLWGLGSHYIDGLRHWFGEVVSASGQLVTQYPERAVRDSNEIVLVDIDDSFVFTLEFASGVWATMTASNAAAFGSGASIEVFGSEGTLVTPQRGVNPPSHGRILAAKLGEEKLEELAIPERLQPFQDERDDRLMPFRLEVREFVRGIREGTSPAPNLYDGWRCQQVLDAVRESSRQGDG